ncbi:cyclophilin-like fold protein [Nocardiopsis valliformis]|uniref:cyclophilin-like fold protein n=1 Tax=Nocardiopsis valliformis TaxID=239974 RepID=UPI000345AEA4|nr:cyclophilin-like fold protein [Nocardiopsis valliformis]
MKIELAVNGTRVKGELYDHPVAREFADLLPLELVFEDFNQVEKVAPLGRSLTLRGVPDADSPRPGEIGYHAPSQGFVLYYGSPGRWPGLVRMGRFDYDLDVLRDLPDGIRIRVTPAPLPSS